MPTTSNFGWTTPADTDLVKNGALAIRTLGNGIDTSLLDLKGGTTGQILSKASNTDLDYTWINNDQGDITEVQAGTGISVASGTGPIPVVTNTVATAFDAKGDLIGGTGADTFARLAVGANNTVLTADSSTATGLKWAAVSTAQNFVKIGSTTNLTGAATITVSNLSGYNQFYLVIDNISTAATYPLITLRLNGDSTGKYSAIGGFQDEVAKNITSVLEDTNKTSWTLGEGGSSAGDYGYVRVLIQGANATGIKPAMITGAFDGTTSSKGYITQGLYVGTSVISSVSILSSSGNFDTGTLDIYGAA